MNRRFAIPAGGVVVLVMSAGLHGADPATEQEFFETKIRPVLVKHCYDCHSSAVAAPKGGLRVDSRELLRRGGESGPGVVPGKSADSLILDALRHDGVEMPPGKKLPSEVIADFTLWVERGAHDPRDQPPTANEAAETLWKMIFEDRRRWWSLQPVRPVAPPKVNDASWEKNRADAFVFAKLKEKGLWPAPSASATDLLRRLSFVLTGLPPRPDQVTPFVQAYANDPDRATAALVDELLASPHFGERFARRWMDVARYGDTYGNEFDFAAKGSWRYRDYLIRAFNNDVGFDQFLKEHIAGDLLETPRIDRELALNESLIGTMFLHLGENRNDDSLNFEGVHQEMINNKIDAFSKGFLATTVACARCHDHKLDAISQRDYFALASVFMTPRWQMRSIDREERNGAAIAKLKALRQSVRASLADNWRSQADRFAEELAAAFTVAKDGPSPVVAARSEKWRKAFPLPAENAKPPAIDDLAALGVR